MGRPKPLLPWGQTSVLEHLITQWQALGAEQVAIVRATDDRAIDAELGRLSFPRENRIDNHEPDRGMFSSIVCAAQWHGWNPSITHWAIALGDQPHLRQATLEKLIGLARDHPGQVCQPILNGRRKHPVVLPKAVFLDLAKSGLRDLKQFLVNYSIAGCDCEDPGLALDIDRPEDYERALGLAGLKAST